MGVGRPVPVDHPGAGLRPEPVVFPGAAADQRRTQAIARGVGLGDRGLEIVDHHHLQQGAEQFDIGPFGHAGDIDDRGRQERQTVIQPHQVLDRASAVRQQIDKAFGQTVGRVVVDHWAHERGRAVKRGAHDQPVGQPVHGIDQVIGDGRLHDQPPRRGAALPRLAKRGLHHQRRCLGDLGRGPRDDRVVAAQIKCDNPPGIGRQPPVQRNADMRRSGKQHPVHPFVAGQILALFGPAHQHLQHTGGNAGAGGALHQQLGGGGHMFRRFEHHHVARDQRRRDPRYRQRQRRAGWRDHRHHPVGFVAQRRCALQRAVEPALRGAFGIGVDRDFDARDRVFDFAARLPLWPAGFTGNQFGQALCLGAHGIGKAADKLDAGGMWLRGPGRPGPARAANHVIHLADGPAPYLGTGGRFQRNDCLACHALPLSVALYPAPASPVSARLTGA